MGALGGLLAQFTISPYLARYTYLINGSENQPIIINHREEIFIQENTALVEAIEKVEKTVVVIESSTKAGKTIGGSGLIVTNDGLIITLASIVPEGYIASVFWEGEELEFKVLKRDIKQNLALLKVEKDHLPTIGFVDSDEVKLGERVFLIGKNMLPKKEEQESVNEGIIKVLSEEYFKTSMVDSINLQGSPLFNIEGKILGLNTVEKSGEIFTIPVWKIRDFLGF